MRPSSSYCLRQESLWTKQNYPLFDKPFKEVAAIKPAPLNYSAFRAIS
jgi:hypothetical protein